MPGNGDLVFSSRGTDLSLGTLQGSDMQRFFPLISPPVWSPPRSLFFSGVPFSSLPAITNEPVSEQFLFGTDCTDVKLHALEGGASR